MKMHIDQDGCDAYAVCEGIRPDMFEVGDDGVVYLLTADSSRVVAPGSPAYGRLIPRMGLSASARSSTKTEEDT